MPQSLQAQEASDSELDNEQAKGNLEVSKGITSYIKVCALAAETSAKPDPVNIIRGAAKK